MKVADILVVESEKKKINVNTIEDELNKITNVDKIVINRVHIPEGNDEDDSIIGIHIVVRDVVEA
ncbi:MULTISPECIES: hypothetical protein [Acidianus]|uniref:Uncharacterized protein n=1 Tax=Candidatus Acidianus copahuensis TaxID=1160895 RepID=A0A031LP08_9CREN|nr:MULTISPECIES: hypothetical protein [Acidianus]EZQ06817.1 hypothetical protein CM19_05440 [Candidatus Acidianus copahuensis]NON61508.1 hypothetical protein [Acidianus sp. RZ1]